MTLPRYRALHAHWQRYPRPEWLIAGYLGFKPKEHQPQPRMPASAPRRIAKPTGAMMNLFNSLGGKPGQTVVFG